ncbi:cupin domain-containing protein [Flavobacterium sp. RHBU_3]|uniref:cupin domain-containing protein n=1 Tax=Flavobacterium sp. RHBU_3 TaxID=3391184 RepID=UPI003984D381
MNPNITITHKTGGEALAVAGGNYRIIIDGSQTGGAYAVIEMVVPPGGGPPPHSHPEIQEMFYVLEGELTFKTEAGNQLVRKDGFVNIPMGGAIHCFKNTSDAYARLLCTVVPAGLEDLFREIGTPVAPGTFLPIPELDENRRAFFKAIDIKYKQKTYPMDYLD